MATMASEGHGAINSNDERKDNTVALTEISNVDGSSEGDDDERRKEKGRIKEQSNLSREIRKTTLSKKGHVTNTESLELSNLLLLLFSLSVLGNTGLVWYKNL